MIKRINPETFRRALVVWLIALLLCSFGNGNTRALTTKTQSANASIRIDAGRVIGPISPLLYGQFIEHMFEGVKAGLDAELLRNRGFEEAPNRIGLSRYWERYPDDRDDDYGINFTWDDSIHYPQQRITRAEIPEHSLRVDAGDGVIQRHGIFQSRVPLRTGVEYQGYLWLRTSNYQGRVTVALEGDSSGGPVYAENSFAPISGDWRKYEFHLQPKKSDSLARVAIIFEGRGRIWLDQASLIANDSIGAVRRDVFEKARALRPAFIRWPGGNVAQDYHWQWAVGPRDERTIWTNLSWKNELEPGDFGTAELIDFSRAIGAEPALTVNVEGRNATVEEAAAWVEYCNGPAATKYGALRVAHGHPDPYNVKLWEIGNEIWGSWVRGHSDANTYARNFNIYSAAMRKVDPSIKLIAVGDNDMNWNRTVLRAAHASIDYLAIHHYYGRREIGGDLRNLMARPLFYERFYQDVSSLLHEVSPERDIGLAINEWGLDLPVEQQYSMLSAIYGARLMNVFERSDGLISMSAVSDMVNGWPGGIIQASRDALFVSPIYLVNQLYSENLGSDRLYTEIMSETFDSTHEGKAVPYLDVVASRSRDRQYIFVKAVNTDLVRPLITSITVAGVKLLPTAEMAIVNGEQIESANSFASPDAVKLVRTLITVGPTFQVTLPAHSVSVLKLKLAR